MQINFGCFPKIQLPELIQETVGVCVDAAGANEKGALLPMGIIVVGGRSLVGRYMSAVGKFLGQPDRALVQPFPISTNKIEKPGVYFHPLLATLITGAARLMLAISETLAKRSGLDWAFCDTDSMALAKPDAMSEADFYKAARSVRDWFTPLNPYRHKDPLFKIEEANLALSGAKVTDELSPLFCLAISDKRYVLFNVGSDGLPIIRKASAHGLGHLLPPYGDDEAPPSIPKPSLDLAKIGVERWQYDLWYQIIVATLQGRPDTIDLNYHPALNNPAASRYGATTPGLLGWFAKYNRRVPPGQRVGPFNFMLAFQVSPHRLKMSRDLSFDEKLRQLASTPKPVSPYGTDISRAARNCFDRETGEPVSVDLLMTYAEALSGYHLHPESKFLNGKPFDRGETQRQNIEAIVIHHIGKEANRWEEQHYLGLSLDAQINYGMAPMSSKDLKKGIKEALRHCPISQREITKRARISRTTLSKIVHGQPIRNADHIVGGVLNVIREAERDKETKQREKSRLGAMRPKEQWLEKIGGFRIGETAGRREARAKEIDRLERLLRSGQVGPEGAELILRRLCDLKGIYFEGYDPPDD